jgi:hypothetical protein
VSKGQIDIGKLHKASYLNFDHRGGSVVFPADVLPGDDGEADVCRVEPILAFAEVHVNKLFILSQ